MRPFLTQENAGRCIVPVNSLGGRGGRSITGGSDAEFSRMLSLCQNRIFCICTAHRRNLSAGSVTVCHFGLRTVMKLR